MEVLLILATLASVIITAPLIWWWYILQKYKALQAIPGPKPLPIVGNAFSVGQTPQSVLANIFNLCQQYGGIFKIFIANEVKVFITDPELVQEILTSNEHITKSEAYDLLMAWVGEGLLISKGDKWKVRRKMITPTFHFKILDQFLEVFNSSANVLLEELSKEVGKSSVNIYPYIDLYTLDVICETALGVKINTQIGLNKKFVEASKGFLDILTLQMFSAWHKFPLLFKLSSLYTAYKSYITTLHNFTDNIILKRREEKIKEKSYSESEEGIKRRVALLDMLLESDLSNEDIRAEIDTFTFAGHDTTLSALSFLLLALAENQDVQEELYNEIISETPEETEFITMRHIQSMKYLDMVIKEILRLYGPVTFVERQLETDTKFGGYDFPKDTVLNLFYYSMSHSEKLFPEPFKFDPLRFLPEKVAQMHNFAYVPFSAGPRNCIGQRFALLEIKTTVIKFLKKMRILPVPGFKPDMGTAAVLKSYNGIWVKLQTRN